MKAACSLMQEMKHHAVLVALATNHSELEISTFLNMARCFVYKIKKELVSSGGAVASVAMRNEHSQQSDVRMPDFAQVLQAIANDDPGKSMRSIAKELQVRVNVRLVVLTVHEDLRCHSYVTKRLQFMPDKILQNRLL